MPLRKAVFAAYRAATRMMPDVKSSYKAQRVAEDVSSKLAILDPRCRIDDISARMPDGYEVLLRVFTPLDIEFTLASGLEVTEDFRGTLLFFHGGGWVNGDVDYYTDTCATMAVKLERRVVSVDYRRAPEHRFPQAPEDCYEVAKQLYAGKLLSDVEPHNIVLFGDSAGGNLAAVVALMARDRGEFKPSTQMLLYPATNNDYRATSPFPSVHENGEDYILTSDNIEEYMELYQSTPHDRDNPYFAPLMASDFSRLPRSLVLTAEYCPLRDEGEAYAKKLAQAGCEVSCYRLLNAVHGYLMYPSVFSVVKDTYRIMRHFLDGEELVQEGEPEWLEILGIA